MLSYSKILHILFLKVSFHTDKYCQILTLIHEKMIFMESIYHLEGIEIIPLGSFFS